MVVFAIVNATVLVPRREPVEHDHFRVPTVIPLIGIGVSIALLTQIEGDVYLRAALLLLLGVALWAVNLLLIRREHRAPLAAEPGPEAGRRARLGLAVPTHP